MPTGLPPAAERDLLARLASSLATLASREREVHRVAPFTVFVDPLSTLKYVSFAQPDLDAGAKELAAALPAVLEVFRANDRHPRTEHIEELCPELSAVAEAQRWTVSERVAVMVVERSTLAPAPGVDGLAVERMAPDVPVETIRELDAAQARAFEESHEELSDAFVARWRERAARDFIYVGRLDGAIVGSAVAIPIGGGVAEVVGVATAPEHRGRGIAAHLTGAAVAAAFAAGTELAFLSAANESAERIYARAGFRAAGVQRGYDGP